MRNPFSSFTSAGVKSAFDALVRVITVLERRGQEETWTPKRVSIPTTPPNDPDAALMYFDEKTKKVLIWDAASERWRFWLTT